jgi:hypothetical protein
MTLSKIVEQNPKHLPQGIQPGTISAVLDLSTAAASFAIGTRPANSVIVSKEIELSGTLSAATAVKFGLGTAADPDKYYLSAGLTTASNKSDFELDADTNVTAAESLVLSACATDGSAAGTIGGGAGQEVKVRITYMYLEGF